MCLLTRCAVAILAFILGTAISVAWHKSFHHSIKPVEVQNAKPDVDSAVSENEKKLEIYNFGRLAADHDLKKGKFKLYLFIYSLDDEVEDIRKEILLKNYGIEQIDIIWTGEMAEYARGYNQVMHPALLKRFGDDIGYKLNQRAIEIKLKRDKKRGL